MSLHPARDSGTCLSVFSASFPFSMLRALRPWCLPLDMFFFPLGKHMCFFLRRDLSWALPSPATPLPPVPVSGCFQLPQGGEEFKVWWVSFSGKLWFVSFVCLIIPFQRWLGFSLEGEQAACFEWSALLYLVITFISKFPVYVHTTWDCQPNELLKFNWVL